MNSTNFSLSNLPKLTAFAGYLLSDKIDDYISVQLEYFYQYDIPLLQFFRSLTEEKRYEISKQTTTEFLTMLSQGKASEQIDAAMLQWKENQLPLIDKDSIAAEDITLMSYVRKKTMLEFIAGYTNNIGEALELVDEIDFFTTQSLTIYTNLFINLLKERMEDHAHLVQKVAETIPGAVYVFDVEQFKGVYSNNKLNEIIGYSHEELNQLGLNAIPSLIHPADQVNFKQNLDRVKEAHNKEIFVSKYRIKTKDGTYKWLANYESVFKRRENASVWQTIGITLDIDSEEKAVAELQQREQQLTEAQRIGRLGNYYWDIANKSFTGSPITFEILGITPSGFENQLQNVHPADKEKLKQETRNALLSGQFNCEYRVLTADGDRMILARGIVDYKDGKAVGITGTVIDMTGRNQLLTKLAEADQRHKGAEALTHIGTYAWNFLKDEIEWSDEMFRIYEAETSTPLSYRFVLSNVHPDDRQMLDRIIKDAIAGKKPYDFYYRINTIKGTEKILHSRGRVQVNEIGEPEKVVGTDQDVTEKQRLIRSLRKSESLYKQAEGLANMGNWSWDVRTNKVEWTDQLYHIYGLQPQSEEISIDRFLSFVHPDDKEFVAAGVDKLNSENAMDYTFRIITNQGEQKWLRSIAQVIRDEDGEASFIIGTEQDVTERQELISRLQESEKLYKQAQSLTRMGNWTWDIQTNVITWSDELFSIYELPVGKTLTPQEWQQYLEPSEKERLDAALEKCLLDQQPMDISHRMVLPNGKIKTLHRKGELIFNKEGKPVKLVGTTQDVTEQKQALETIKEQEHFIQQIADASPTILYLFDVPSQSIAYINHEAFFVLGYLPDEITAMGADGTNLLYHPDDVALLPCRRPVKKTFQQVDSMIQYECRMSHKDGGYRWLLVREIVFKKDDEGNITQIIGAALDINRRKEMEKTILQNTLQLQQSNASLEEFAYVASHDLKEPLRKISTFGDRLVASQMDKLSDEGKIYLRKIVDASQRMQNMISDLLSISLISGDRSFELHSLQQIAEETVQTLEFKIEQQNAIVRYDQLPEISIIPSQIRQLFLNLVSNSLKFVREDVQPLITIDCTEVDPGEVGSYQIAKAEKYIKLSFADNGIGFENEYAQKIFAIFQRLHGRSEYEGSGIGLAICKKIVEHHGGVIFAHGRPAEGATFTIILPA